MATTCMDAVPPPASFPPSRAIGEQANVAASEQASKREKQRGQKRDGGAAAAGGLTAELNAARRLAPLVHAPTD